MAPVGHDRGEAEPSPPASIANVTSAPPRSAVPSPSASSCADTWLPQKRRQVRPTTAYRYAWFVDRYIIPAIGDIPCGGYGSTTWTLSTRSSRPAAVENGTGLAPKTVLEVHMVIRAALDAAGQRELVERNVASAAHVRRRRPAGGPPGPGQHRNWPGS